MSSFSDYLSHGNPWLFVPVAILLGILHGFEPGHSKTMMAAFIIAVRGTVAQAVLLGVAATVSHTAIIWILAAIGLHYTKEINAEHLEPYFAVVTGVIVMAMAGWMFLRTRREEKERLEHEQAHARLQPVQAEASAPVKEQEPVMFFSRQELAGHAHTHSHSHSHGNDHGHDHDHDHGHSHESGVIFLPTSAAIQRRVQQHGGGAHGGKMVDTGHGWLEVSIYDAEGPPRFRIYSCRASGQAMPLPRGTSVNLETARLDGSSQKFLFDAKEGYWESTAVLPEPRSFLAIIRMTHSNHTHTYRLQFGADAPALPEPAPASDSEEYQDAHQRAHAEEIKERFASGRATTWQVILFGLAGGLMPCSAALTVLLLCLQTGKFLLGMMVVLAFSIGLAITLVAFGAVAAISIKAATKRFKNLEPLIRKMPYASATLMIVVGLVIVIQGARALGKV
jgi:nickel/cobalt exporter